MTVYSTLSPTEPWKYQEVTNSIRPSATVAANVNGPCTDQQSTFKNPEIPFQSPCIQPKIAVTGLPHSQTRKSGIYRARDCACTRKSRPRTQCHPWQANTNKPPNASHCSTVLPNPPLACMFEISTIAAHRARNGHPIIWYEGCSY